MWPLWWHLSKAWHGPALMDVLPGRGGRRLTLGKIPEGGLHVDVPRKTVGGARRDFAVAVDRAIDRVIPVFELTPAVSRACRVQDSGNRSAAMAVPFQIPAVISSGRAAITSPPLSSAMTAIRESRS